ncbi:hypothetical protein O0I10_011547 [Lichtheimia ornata]|uniref:F-box domain-containing protein n=1 Tax=Lichtheimia ornata TaxID=688661 RepID=A0AAD7XTZ6_9FUNG|nr:uncharacterized protein O0I10_011547 [Lichtheimia ornata]KAJ8652808.1 hypothetical protein O0I10_011547 [Lichtheimia ornata]
MEYPMRNRSQDHEVGESLNVNEELLRPMGAELGRLLSMKKVDEALSFAKEMKSMAPALSTATFYERLIVKVKRLWDNMDESAASMATLNDSITKIDFISRLPFDIAIHVVDYLWGIVSNMEDDTTPTFLYVSKHWRQTILETTPFLSYSLPATKILDHDKATSSHASRIRTMTIHGNVISFSALLGIHLANLKHLCIHIPTDTTSCIHGYETTCARGVCSAVRHNYNLDEVMERCPNLVSLKWSGCVLNGPTTKQYHQLRVLQLRDDEDEIDELLVKLPCLVVFSIEGIRDINYLKRVSSYCPSLKYLKYNAPHDDVIEWPYEWDTSLEQGIQEFSFHSECDDDVPLHMIENLVHASKTLRYLHIGENIYANFHHAMPLPHDTSFSHLIRLSFESQYDDDGRDFLLSIVRRSPCLETIKSVPPFLKWDEQESLDLMSSYTTLVNTTVIMGEDDQNVDALRRFLNTHIERGGYSALRSLAIAPWTEECAQQLLPLITQLTLLEDLHIAVSLDSLLPLIMDSIATTNVMKIKQLKISFVRRRIEDPVFARLQHAHTLESLIIDASRLSTMAALSLIELTQLLHIQIPFDSLDALVIDILRKQFPSIKELEPHHMLR